MAAFYRLIHPPEQALVGTVVKKEDYCAIMDAKSLRDETSHQAEKILADAQKAYEEQRQKGYEEGLQAAKEDIAEKIYQLASEREKDIAQLQKLLPDLIFEGVSSIVHSIPHKELLPEVIRKVLKHESLKLHVILRVNPDHLHRLKGELEELKRVNPLVEDIELFADFDLGPDQAVLESPYGIVDASVETQLLVLKRFLGRSLQRKARHESVTS